MIECCYSAEYRDTCTRDNNWAKRLKNKKKSMVFIQIPKFGNLHDKQNCCFV